MTNESLWGGRFSKPPASETASFSSSLHFDARMWRQDLDSTGAHAAALHRAGLLTDDELQSIQGALEEAAGLFQGNRFDFDASDEDIHSAIERFLTDRLGETGAKIHAGRSRNDLVVTDLRLWLKESIPRIARAIHELQEALYRQARDHDETLAPGYTHLQPGQPILLAHHLLAHAFALARDFERIIAAYRRTDVSPLGAAAFAGTTLPTDAKQTAIDLGFSKVFDNAADAVADRDFALEFLSASAITAVHLSRLAEEIVIWTTSEFGFVELDDAYATGSSIMPNKKNPDLAELTRAKSSRVTANLMHLLGAMKGLPLTYDRDLQEDKEPVFDTADTLIASLTAMRGLVQTMSFDKDRLEEAATKGSTGATDLAEWLVKKGIPFREAHTVVGKMVESMLSDGRVLADAGAEDLQMAHPSFTSDALDLLDPRRSVEARVSHGGTAPERVAEQFGRIEGIMDDEERWLAGFGAYE